MTEKIMQVEKDISECYAMIDHFIQLKNKEEIAYWRKALQIAKIQKRRLQKS